MAINETLSSNTPSASSTATKDTSEVHVMSFSKGKVSFEFSLDSGTSWNSLSTIYPPGKKSFCVATPDKSILYRFRPYNVDSVQVYFGP